MKNKGKIAFVNGLTTSRIFGSILLPLVFSLTNPLIGLAYVLLLLSTDALDGFLAKHVWHVTTLGGSILDAVSDKVFEFLLLGYLSCMFPVLTLPLIMEVVIALNNANGIYKGANLKSSRTGKNKTILLFALIFLGFASLTYFPSIAVLFPFLSAFTVGFQLNTLVGYVKEKKKVKGNERAKKKINLEEVKEYLKKKGIFKKVIFNPEIVEKYGDKSFIDQFFLGVQDLEAKENQVEVEKKVEEKSLNDESTSLFSIELKNYLKVKFNLNNKDIAFLENYYKDREFTEQMVKDDVNLYNSFVKEDDFEDRKERPKRYELKRHSNKKLDN